MSTLTIAHGGPRLRGLGDVVAPIVVSLLVGSVVGWLVWTSEPDRVERVAVSNPTGIAVHVGVSPGPDGPVLPLSQALPRTTTTTTSVLDQGDTWTFRFRYLDVEQPVTYAREDLRDMDWTVTVPDEFAAEALERYPPVREP